MTRPLGLLTLAGMFAADKADVLPPADPSPGDGSSQLTAVEICLMPQTEVFLVTDTASGEKQYQAKQVTSAVRYDLTWQVESPESIAIEETYPGGDFRPRADLYGPEFAACIAGKTVTPVQGSH
jgi:hypothetical protein